jgi:hypothetical protein
MRDSIINRIHLQLEFKQQMRWAPVQRQVAYHLYGDITMKEKKIKQIDLYSESFDSILRGLSDGDLLDMYELVMRQSAKQM